VAVGGRAAVVGIGIKGAIRISWSAPIFQGVGRRDPVCLDIWPVLGNALVLSLLASQEGLKSISRAGMVDCGGARGLPDWDTVASAAIFHLVVLREPDRLGGLFNGS
jgi:hypothetical protein